MLAAPGGATASPIALMSSVLRVDRSIPGCAWATIDHPPLHLVNWPFLSSVRDLLDQVEADRSIRVLVFDSADAEFFLMHGDVEQILGSTPPEGDAAEPNIAAQTFERVRVSRLATIGLINGQARGGGSEFLSSLDMRFAGPRTVLGQPEVAMGILPGASGTQRLARLVGRARALEIILGCDDVIADEAAAMGYVNRVLPEAQLRPFVERLARRLGAMSAAAIEEAKAAVDLALPPVNVGLVNETNAYGRLVRAGEHKTYMQRFLDAGGQTRDGETQRMPAIVDRMLDLD